MLNFAEQTGSGAVIVVWSFLFVAGAKVVNIRARSEIKFHVIGLGGCHVHLNRSSPQHWPGSGAKD